MYTFATIRQLVSDVQCGYLTAADPTASCDTSSQTWMWASEQGWPFNNVTMPKTKQARNICLAHGLSLAAGRVWAVTHNFFQGAGPSSEGDAGDFGLVPYPPKVWANLTNGPGNPTYDAYTGTAPGVWGYAATGYCCVTWGVGCP
jgi:hypothetical protein